MPVQLNALDVDISQMDWTQNLSNYKMTENTDEGHLDNPEKNTQSEYSPDEIIPAKETATIITNHENENMEVHKHPHHVMHKKKWPEYLLEFFMLFLAVYLGFLAENRREHSTELEKEKQFMLSLIDDIRADTMEVNKSISIAATAIRYEDSVIFFLYNIHPVDFIDVRFLDFDMKALLRLKIVFNEGTALQLKNAGNLRLIRNHDIIKNISMYWNEQENTKIVLDRYLNYRNRGREFLEKLLAFSDNDLVEANLIKPFTKGVRVIKKDPELWSEYANILSHCRVTTKIYSEQLKKQFTLANELIRELQNEYPTR